ncbi:hypothetical protein GCM10022380_21660 [Amycolatopsis tucumanensis]|uniref:Uncharacterized protein n=1 Tax=Amycolatopsis tucumanensis TaxID=401106 RepID=A0ABP7HWM9_9PSEU
MAGHGRLGEAGQRRDQIARGQLALGQKVQQGAPAGLGHRFEDVHPRSITQDVYKRQQICGFESGAGRYPGSTPKLKELR